MAYHAHLARVQHSTSPPSPGCERIAITAASAIVCVLTGLVSERPQEHFCSQVGASRLQGLVSFELCIDSEVGRNMRRQQ